MNKHEIYAELERRGLWHEITEHPAVYNMDELAQLRLPHPESDAKNLFVRDDKRRNYYMITVKGEKRVDLKAFRRQNGTKALTFASGEELQTILELTPGSVTPFGLLNDRTHTVQLFLDRELTEPPGLIGVHPNDNTATVWLKTADLLQLLRENGCEVHVTDFS